MPSITAFNVAHLHLLLNHIPTVGSVVALGLLILALVRRNEHLTHAGLEVLFAIAVLTLPAYMSGAAAYQTLRDQPGISDTAMRIHQDAALAGFTVLEFAGFVAWVALWQTRRRGRAAPGLVPATLLLSIVALALMARAATLGGDIRHPELGDRRERARSGAIRGVEDQLGHGEQHVGLAGLRDHPFPRSLPVVRCVARRQPADTRRDETRAVW